MLNMRMFKTTSNLVFFILVINLFLIGHTSHYELNKINEINGPFSEEDYREMKEESEKLLTYLISNKQTVFSDNKIIIDLISNSTEVPVNEMSLHLNPNPVNHTDSFFCKTCLWTFGKFHNLLKKKFGMTLLNEFLTLFCSIVLRREVCRNAIYLYSPIVIDSLIEHYLDAEFICTKNYMCKFRHFIELDPDDYARQLLKDKPNKIEEIVKKDGETLKVLHVTDIHTDFNYKEVNYIY